MAGFKHGTLRKLVSMGRERTMANGYLQGKQKTPYRWDFIYMFSVPWRWWGSLLHSDPQKMLHPMFYKPVATFWIIQSKCLFIIGKVSAAIRKEKKRQIKTEFMNPKQFLERHVPHPQLFLFFFFTNEFLVRPFGIFLVWSIISSSLRRMPLSPWCIFLTEPSLLGLLYHKSHSITFDNLY